MRILFGVQGTGNGHLSRARALAAAFSRYPDLTIDWLISARTRDQFNDMRAFGDFQWRRGLTFHHKNGKIQKFQTLRNVKPIQFLRDITSLDLQQYDAILTDFEPVTAWAARIRGRQCIGIGHQYAFRYPVPVEGPVFPGRSIMRFFAPSTMTLGLHWHHFGSPILPPIVDLENIGRAAATSQRVVVYLPFENPRTVVTLLNQFSEKQFSFFGPGLQCGVSGNVKTYPVSRDRFVEELVACDGIICNTGFELISEALSLGKRILTKPLGGQLEQLSNTAALSSLNYADVMVELNADRIAEFLVTDKPIPMVTYPNVAGSIAEWLANGIGSIEELANSLWSQTAIDWTYPRARGIAGANAAAVYQDRPELIRLHRIQNLDRH